MITDNIIATNKKIRYSLESPQCEFSSSRTCQRRFSRLSSSKTGQCDLPSPKFSQGNRSEPSSLEDSTLENSLVKVEISKLDWDAFNKFANPEFNWPVELNPLFVLIMLIWKNSRVHSRIRVQCCHQKNSKPGQFWAFNSSPLGRQTPLGRKTPFILNQTVKLMPLFHINSPHCQSSKVTQGQFFIIDNHTSSFWWSWGLMKIRFVVRELEQFQSIQLVFNGTEWVTNFAILAGTIISIRVGCNSINFF